jgi:hypothetical protein
MNFCSDPVVKFRSLLLTAFNRQQLAPEQIKPPAQDHEIPENLFKRGPIGAPEFGDGLEVRLAPQQPDDLNVAMTFGLKPTARPMATCRHSHLVPVGRAGK